MKKCLMMVLALVALTACNNGKGSEESAAVGVKVNTTEIKGNYVYDIGDLCYATVEYSVEWPESVEGINLDSLQAFLLEAAFDTAGVDVSTAMRGVADRFVVNYKGKPTTSLTLEQVKKMRDSKDDLCDEYFPSLIFTVDCEEYDSVRNLIEVKVTESIDTDNGLAAGMGFYEYTYYYDCERQCRLTLADVVADEKAMLDIVKKKALGMDEDMCVMEELVNDLKALPAIFILDDYDLVFTFNKYEIACAAAGNIDIKLSSLEIENLLTPLGKKLLCTFVQDEAMNKEVTDRMNDYIAKCLHYDKTTADNTNAQLFLTSDYIEEYDECDKLYEDEGMSWMNFDPWIDAQDYDEVKFEVKQVLVKNKDKAMVVLNVTNYGKTNTKWVKMKRENGLMKIDDFETSGTSMRTMMQNVINKN